MNFKEGEVKRQCDAKVFDEFLIDIIGKWVYTFSF